MKTILLVRNLKNLTTQNKTQLPLKGNLYKTDNGRFKTINGHLKPDVYLTGSDRLRIIDVTLPRPSIGRTSRTEVHGHSRLYMS